MSKQKTKKFDIQKAYQANKERHDAPVSLDSFKQQYTSLRPKENQGPVKKQAKDDHPIKKSNATVQKNQSMTSVKKSQDRFYNRLFDELHNPDTRERFFSQNNKSDGIQKTDKNLRILDEFNNYLSEKVAEKGKKTKKEPASKRENNLKDPEAKRASCSFVRKIPEGEMEKARRDFSDERVSSRSPEINLVSKNMNRSIENLREWGNYLQHKHQMMRQVYYISLALENVCLR